MLVLQLTMTSCLLQRHKTFSTMQLRSGAVEARHAHNVEVASATLASASNYPLILCIRNVKVERKAERENKQT